jgi:hypothetical protein
VAKKNGAFVTKTLRFRTEKDRNAAQIRLLVSPCHTDRLPGFDLVIAGDQVEVAAALRDLREASFRFKDMKDQG